MWALLTNARTNTSFRKTNDLVTKILIRAIATGAVNAVVNGLEVLFILHWPENDLSEVPSYLGGKLYSNAFMSTLNARATDSNDNVISVSNSTDVGSGSGTLGHSKGHLKTLTFANPKPAHGTGHSDMDSTTMGGMDIQMSSLGKKDVSPFDYSVAP